MAEISRAETLRILEGIPLFSGLTKRQLTAVAKVMDHASFKAGDVLVKELEVGQRLIIIREGTAQVNRRGIATQKGTDKGIEQGTSRRLATVGPGDIVGELSLIDGKRTSASVVADTPMETLVIYRTRFNKLLDSTPQMCQRLLLGLAARLRAIDQRTDFIG